MGRRRTEPRRKHVTRAGQIKTNHHRKTTTPAREPTPVYISLDILFDILCWLPVRSLLRFKCVSKSWRALIEDPNFIKIHLECSTNFNTSGRIVLPCWHNDELHRRFYCFDIGRFERPIEVLDPVRDVTRASVSSYIVGSCNGLIALRSGSNSDSDSDKDRSIVVWNPSTGKCQTIKLKWEQSFDWNSATGFGYDSIGDDYKSVSIDWSSMNDCVVRVHSLKSNSWNISEYSLLDRFSWKCGVSVSNGLHWLSDQSFRLRIILKFDLRTKKFSKMRLPNCGGADGDSLGLSVLRGSLCVSYSCKMNFMDCTTDIWVREKYGSELELWTKLLTIESSYDFLLPVTLSKGSHRLLMRSENALFWYDLEKKVFSKNFFVKMEGKNKCSYGMLFCAGSLVNPNKEMDQAEEMNVQKHQPRKLEWMKKQKKTL